MENRDRAEVRGKPTTRRQCRSGERINKGRMCSWRRVHTVQWMGGWVIVVCCGMYVQYWSAVFITEVRSGWNGRGRLSERRVLYCVNSDSAPTPTVPAHSSIGSTATAATPINRYNKQRRITYVRLSVPFNCVSTTELVTFTTISDCMYTPRSDISHCSHDERSSDSDRLYST